MESKAAAEHRTTLLFIQVGPQASTGRPVALQR